MEVPAQKPEKAETGRRGEDAAAAMLERRGWRILDRNWRSRHLELDIVAREKDVIVFVEVKTRAAGGMQQPFEALGKTKRERLARAACAWLREHDSWGCACRFDLAAVRVRDGHYETELMQNVMEFGEYGNALDRGHSAWQPW